MVRSFRRTSFLPMQLTLSSVESGFKKVQCIGRAPQAERGLISMRKSNEPTWEGKEWEWAAGGTRGKTFASRRNTTCHVAKLGIRFGLGNDVVTSAACRAIGGGS